MVFVMRTRYSTQKENAVFEILLNYHSHLTLNKAKISTGVV